MVSSGLLRRVALVETVVSEEPGSSFIRVTKIGELGTTQAATSNPTYAAKKYHKCFLLVIIIPIVFLQLCAPAIYS
jgi:hypothetical protein